MIKFNLSLKMKDFGASSDNLFIWGQKYKQSKIQDCMHSRPRSKVRGFFVCLVLFFFVNITLKKQSL